jgi:putative serine protease PepD
MTPDDRIPQPDAGRAAGGDPAEPDAHGGQPDPQPDTRANEAAHREATPEPAPAPWAAGMPGPTYGPPYAYGPPGSQPAQPETPGPAYGPSGAQPAQQETGGPAYGPPGAQPAQPATGGPAYGPPGSQPAQPGTPGPAYGPSGAEAAQPGTPGPAYGPPYGGGPGDAAYGAPYGAGAGGPVGSPYGSTPAAGPTPARTGRRRGRIAALLAAVAVGAAAVGGAAGAAVNDALTDDQPAASALSEPPASAPTSADTGSIQQVAARVLPSVVSIVVNAGGQGGEGTGVILSADGQILTNNHVVEAAANRGNITVRFSDGTSATARIVGRDEVSDLAVLQAEDVSGLRPATLGRSADLAVGQTVVAIGSPLGLSGTVTSGIVSALNRPVQASGGNGGQATVIDAIQTDAAINPGNSGGPLVNLAGQVVGINSAIASLGGGPGGQSGNIGLGFAIPIDQARPIAQQLADSGRASHAQLGVRVTDAGDAGNPTGARIAEVTSGGAADEAGLRAGDVITKVGDREIADADELVAAIRSQRPDAKVTITYERGGDSHTTTVTLGSSTG